MMDSSHERMSPAEVEGTTYQFRAPINIAALKEKEPLFTALVHSDTFRRLSDIRFLGGIDYLLVPWPNGSSSRTRYTRLQHSVGVASLALSYCEHRELSPELRRLAYSAALLHDIGHAPLSHSVEQVFKLHFGIDHHSVTSGIVTGRLAYGQDVSQLLRQHNVDPDRVNSILDGEYDPFEGFFSGPINFDTIEGIMRSRRYLKHPAAGHSPLDVVKAATLRENQRDQDTVDAFWRYKDEVYNYIIRSRSGVIVDHACSVAVENCISKLSPTDYFCTERQFFRKVPALRRLLNKHALAPFYSAGAHDNIEYQARHFFVDPEVNFFERNDKARYRQSKENQVLAWGGAQPLGEDWINGELFGDEGVRKEYSTLD